MLLIKQPNNLINLFVNVLNTNSQWKEPRKRVFYCYLFNKAARMRVKKGWIDRHLYLHWKRLNTERKKDALFKCEVLAHWNVLFCTLIYNETGSLNVLFNINL